MRDYTLYECLKDRANPMYFNVDQVPIELRAETQVLLTDRTIHGDGKKLLSIRKNDLMKAIDKRRLEEGREPLMQE